MGAFQNYPYADVHQLNLDWMIKEVKEVKNKTADIDQKVEEAKGYAEESASNAEAVSDDKEAVERSIQEWNDDVSTLKQEVSNNSVDIAVQTARIDTIISGVTPDADAELLDIRVGADGVVFPTAGDAVRGQVTDLANEVDSIGELTNSRTLLRNWEQGRRSTGSTSAQYLSSNIFKVPCSIEFDDTVYKISFIRCNVDGTVVGSPSSWKTTSPVDISVNASYDYCWIEITRQDSANMTSSDVTAITSGTYKTYIYPIVSRINELISGGAYVDGVNGLDTNNGTANSPFKTIQKAVNAGVKTIFVAFGTYNERVLIQNVDEMEILPWSYDPSFDPSNPDTPKIIITGSPSRNISSAVSCRDCGKIRLVGIAGDCTSASVFEILRVKDFVIEDCEASDTLSSYCGFQVNTSNGVLRHCVAHDIGLDGFNFHNYGNTQLFDCVAYDCGDDGVSHHDGCTGLIVGGEFYNCGKGGVASPTYGSRVDIYNVLSRDNVFGLYASTDNSRRDPAGIVSGCVFKNNSMKDIRINNATITGWNNIYDTKQVTGTGVFTEY